MKEKFKLEKDFDYENERIEILNKTMKSLTKIVYENIISEDKFKEYGKVGNSLITIAMKFFEHTISQSLLASDLIYKEDAEILTKEIIEDITNESKENLITILLEEIKKKDLKI